MQLQSNSTKTLLEVHFTCCDQILLVGFILRTRKIKQGELEESLVFVSREEVEEY